MKTKLLFIVLAFIVGNSLQSQIKIGDNPQNIDPSSVLELESTSRVLVITRINDAQMNSISPLRGAMVYNTDQECIHYYNGTEWVNICEALDNSFTVSSNAVFNPFARDSTVVVTQNGANYNFEVNQITGDNIIDTSINGAVEIQEGSITGEQIQEDSITYDKLAIGGTTGDILQWNGAQWRLINIDDVTVTEVDGVIGNEYNIGMGLTDTSIEITDGGGTLSQNLDPVFATDLELANAITAINLAGDVTGPINNTVIANNAVTSAKIGTAGAADANKVLGTDTAGDPQWLNATDLSTNLGQDVTSTNGSITGTQADAALVAMDLEVNVDGTTIEVDATNGLQIPDNGVTTAKIGTAGAADANKVLGTDTAGDPQWQDAANLATSLGQDVTSTNGSITGTQADAALVAMDLEVNVDGTTIEVDATNGLQIPDNGVTTAKIGTAGAADANKVLGTDTAGDPQWLNATDLSTNLGQDVTSTNGSITGTQADAALVAMDLEVNVDGTTIEVDATNGLQIPDNGVTTAKIGTAGAADANKVLGTDTAGDPQWLNATDLSTNLGQDVTSTNGSITGTQADAALVAMDLEVNVDGTTIEVDATNGLQVPDGGITLAKLADAAADDQVMQWNSTTAAWELVDGSALQQTISGTSGSIFFSDGDDGLLENNANLFWDNTFDSGNGALGLGTTTPQTKLHIWEAAGNDLTYGLQLQNANNNASGGSATGILFSVEASGNFGKGGLVYERNDNAGRGDFHFLQNTGGVNVNPDLLNDYDDVVMTIKNSGEVGIGEVDPQAQLHIKRNAGNNLFYGLQLQNANNNGTGGSASGILFAVEATGNYGKGALVYERKDQNAKGDFHFLQNTDNNQDVPDLSHAIMTIKNDGKVGIGTTAPNSTLETAGSYAASIIPTVGDIILDASHYTIILAGNHEVTLPIANTCQGRIYIIKNTTVFNPAISSYFDSVGAATTAIPTGVVQLQSDGANWQQIN